MKNVLFSTICICLLLASTACVNQVNTGKLVGTGSNLAAEASVSDQDLKSASAQMRQRGDAQANVAGPKSTYTKRLTKLMGKHTAVNNTPLNYKAYITPEVNANASADGSVRVYSGLMDLMNDDELRFVLGHEIGHVAEGHTLAAMRTAYSTADRLSDSMLGDLLEAVINAQFSQSQESSADVYAMNFLKQNNYNTAAAASALRKLQALGGSGGGMFASHPDSGKRAEKMEKSVSK